MKKKWILKKMNFFFLKKTKQKDGDILKKGKGAQWNVCHD